jgi:hypothetical protein
MIYASVDMALTQQRLATIPGKIQSSYIAVAMIIIGVLFIGGGSALYRSSHSVCNLQSYIYDILIQRLKIDIRTNNNIR